MNFELKIGKLYKWIGPYVKTIYDGNEELSLYKNDIFLVINTTTNILDDTRVKILIKDKVGLLYFGPLSKKEHLEEL
jgi:hypothetical protein